MGDVKVNKDSSRNSARSSSKSSSKNSAKISTKSSAKSSSARGVKSNAKNSMGDSMRTGSKDVAKENIKKNAKRKRGSVGTVILDILLAVFVCTALFSGYKVVSQLITDKQGEDVYDGIASMADVQETMVVRVTRPASSSSKAVDGAGIAALFETDTAREEPVTDGEGNVVDDSVAEQPTGEEGEPSGDGVSDDGNPDEDDSHDSYDEEPEPIVIRQFDWAALRSENSDCVGWLECDDTVINYPVVQGRDNSYYLNHLFNGKEQRYGTLFIDAQNEKDFSDENTIIYGHHLKNGKMFGTLMYYGDGNKYYRKHPVFKLYTPEHVYLVELFANVYVDGANGIPMTFSTKEEYAKWIDRMYRLSTFDSDVVMTTDDRMVTLYTCSYDYDTQRQLLVGKLVPLT